MMMQQSESYLRMVFAAAKNVSFIKTDANGKETKIIDFSPGAEHIFGYKAEEIIREVTLQVLQKKRLQG